MPLMGVRGTVLVLELFVVLLGSIYAIQNVEAAPGDFIVTEHGTGELLRVTPSGTVTTIASGLSFPLGVAIDTNGDFIVTNNGSRELLRVTPSGTVTTIASGINVPAGVAVDTNGDYIVADNGNGELLRITPSGTVTTIATVEFPNGVVVDTNGDFIVADTGTDEVLRVTPSGTVTTIASGVFRPIAITMDTNGDFIVTAASPDNLLRVTPSGTVTTILSTGGSSQGVATDTNGDFIVSSLNAGELSRVTPSGTVTTIASGLSSPTGVAIEPGAVPPNTPPNVLINSPSGGDMFLEGELVTLEGEANDFEDGILEGIIEWTSNLIGGILGTGTPVQVNDFAPGIYVITATVTDSGGLVDSDSIEIEIKEKTPKMAIEDWIEEIQGLIDDGMLGHGIGNSLLSSLEAAEKSIEKGNTNSACGQLGSVINEINAKDGKVLTPIQAQEFREAVNEIKLKLNC